MTGAILTIDQINAMARCAQQPALFVETFGDRVNVTVEDVVKFQHLFDWTDARRLLDAEADVAYAPVVAQARVDYYKALGKARIDPNVVFLDARQEARLAYDRALAPAWAAGYIATRQRGRGVGMSHRPNPALDREIEYLRAAAMRAGVSVETLKARMRGAVSVDIRIGDVRAQLALIPGNSIDCVVTSPPYWGLRDYGVAGQIGLEPTLGEHMGVMVEVFRDVRRVLKAHGTVWLNYGDCYAAQPNGKSAAAYKADGSDDRTFRDKPFSTVQGVLKPKDLCMLPNRLAIALQDDGWYVRSEIIWHKPNPMPESVYDRPTTAHEKIWLLSKNEDYFYNHAAIREPVTGTAHARKPGPNSRQNVDRVPVSRKVKVPGGWDVEPGAHGTINRSGRTEATYVSKVADEADPLRKSKPNFAASTGNLVETRNARNVWTIAPKPFREAHFATFPPALAERCIKAGVPESVCGMCGAVDGCGGLCAGIDRRPGVVLDPFGGAGTVGLVAEQLGLDAILIELNPDYAEIARRRIYGELEAAA